MITAIIIDDEPSSISVLQNDLKMFCPYVRVVAACTSGKDALIAINKHKPQLLFLDIEMPWMNGLELLEALGDNLHFQVVFITAHERFAAKAFRLDATDYLLKPFDSHDLLQAVEKVRLKLEKSAGNQPERLVSTGGYSLNARQIALPNRDGYEFVAADDIQYCQANGAYTNVVLVSQHKILLSMPLGEVSELLPAGLFERVHHSTVVNLRYVKHLIRKEGTYIVMADGERIAVSKSKKEKLLQRLGIT